MVSQISRNDQLAAEVFQRAAETINRPEHTAQSTEPPVSADVGKKNSNKKFKLKLKLKLFKSAIIALVGGVVSVGAFMFWQRLSTYQETDDAYVTAHVTPISSRIETNVDQVFIDDNQEVKKGQLLVSLDPRDFQRRVDEARTELERVRKESLVAHSNISLFAMNAQASKLNAEGDVAGSTSAIDKANVAIREAQYALEEQQQVLLQKDAELTRAELDYERYKTLEVQGAVTTSQRDAARRDLDVAKSACDATKQAIEQKRALIEEAQNQLKIARAQNVQSQGNQRTAKAREIQTDVSRLQEDVSAAAIKESEAKLQNALLQLSYSGIHAPVSGRVGRKTLEVGQRVQPGSRLFTLTEDDIWVVANFKEIQLENMQVGQPVEVTVDALPHVKLQGVVDSFSPGSGAQFTLLPPDNATGNFTKIVQRVPVKVRFKESIAKFREKLVPGLSAVVSVKVK